MAKRNTKKAEAETTTALQTKWELGDIDEELRALFMEGNDDDFQVDPEDLTMPRINLQQFTSRLVKHEGITAGTWSNNVDDYAYTDDPDAIIEVVPIRHYKSRVAFWPMEAPREGVRCQSMDYVTGSGDPGGVCANCPMQVWNGNKPPQCDLTHNFLVYVLGDHGEDHQFALMSFRSSAFKEGKNWLKNAKIIKGRIFTNVYRMSSKMETDAGNDWYVPKLVKWEDTNRYEKPVTHFFDDKDQAMMLLRKFMETAEMVGAMRAAGRFTVVDEGDAGQAQPDAPGATDDTPPEEDIDWGAIDEAAEGE